MAIIQEHDAPNKSTDPKPGYSPTPEEQAAIKYVEKTLAKNKRARQLYDRNWADNYRFYRGKQWKQKRPSYRHSEVFNIVFAEVQTALALLTDVRPSIETLPEDPTDFEFAEIIGQIIESKWDTNNWNYTVAECITDSGIYGTGIGHVPWKQELLDGIGDYVFESADPFWIYPDPNARSKFNDEHCEDVVIAEPTDLSKLKREYPQVAEFLTADIADVESMDVRKEDKDEIIYKSPSDNRIQISEGQSFQKGRDGQALKVTLYCRSNEKMEKELDPKVDPATGAEEKQYQTMKKYPFGRKIVVVNGVLCEDTSNEDYDNRFPLARLVDHFLPRQFWGIGEVENLESSQNVINVILSHILDVLKLCANPVWVVDTESGVEEDNIINRPGLVITKNKGSEVRREGGVEIPSFILNTLQVMMDRVMTKLGSTQEVSRGASPSPNASGYAIEQLQEAAQTKIRTKARNLEVFLKEVGDLMFDRIMRFYSLPRVVRISNNPEASKYFKFHITEAQDEEGNVSKTAIVQPFDMDDMGNQAWSEPREVKIKSRVDIKFAVGTSLPFAKAQKAALAEKLFSQGIIDAEEYLTQIDYPNKEKIIEKLNQKQAAGMPPPGPQGQGAPPPPMPAA
jgi:hypothetical protein